MSKVITLENLEQYKHLYDTLMVAPERDNLTSGKQNECCIYQERLWRCKKAGLNDAEWEQINIDDLSVGSKFIAAEYATNKAYYSGDLCIHEKAIYVANDHATGEWDASKWTAVSGLQGYYLNDRLSNVLNIVDIQSSGGVIMYPTLDSLRYPCIVRIYGSYNDASCYRLYHHSSAYSYQSYKIVYEDDSYAEISGYAIGDKATVLDLLNADRTYLKQTNADSSDIEHIFMTKYSITANITGGYVDYGNFMYDDTDLLSVYVRPAFGYETYGATNMSASNCSFTYSYNTFYLSNPTGDIVLTGQCHQLTPAAPATGMPSKGAKIKITDGSKEDEWLVLNVEGTNALLAKTTPIGNNAFSFAKNKVYYSNGVYGMNFAKSTAKRILDASINSIAAYANLAYLDCTTSMYAREYDYSGTDTPDFVIGHLSCFLKGYCNGSSNRLRLLRFEDLVTYFGSTTITSGDMSALCQALDISSAYIMNAAYNQNGSPDVYVINSNGASLSEGTGTGVSIVAVGQFNLNQVTWSLVE